VTVIDNYFDRKTVLVTGASSGIGREFAIQLHRAGARVLMVARRKDRLEELCINFNKLRPNSSRSWAVDLSSDLSRGEVLGIEDFLPLLDQEPVDILVNNAGAGSFGEFETLPIERECELVNLNVLATMRVAHHLIPAMKKRGAGGIINVSSIAGFQPIPYMATYSATKAFNLFQAMAWRYELQRFGIRVLIVCPGPVDTEFGGVARVPGEFTGIKRDLSAEVVAQSLAAFKKNRAIVIPGRRAKLLILPLYVFPLALTTWFTERALRRVLPGRSEI